MNKFISILTSLAMLIIIGLTSYSNQQNFTLPYTGKTQYVLQDVEGSLIYEPLNNEINENTKMTLESFERKYYGKKHDFEELKPKIGEKFTINKDKLVLTYEVIDIQEYEISTNFKIVYEIKEGDKILKKGFMTYADNNAEAYMPMDYDENRNPIPGWKKSVHELLNNILESFERKYYD